MTEPIVHTIVRPDRASALRFMQALLSHADEYGLWLRSDGMLLHWEMFAIGESEDGPRTVVIRQRRQR